MTELERLESIVAHCNKCQLCESATYKVFGEGNPKAKIMFVGEAPGREENASGRPFVGGAGKLLEKAFTKLSIKRSSVYISNIVHCWPPGNRKPTPSETSLCLPYLESQIKCIKPKVIVALGATSMHALTDQHSSIGKVRGRAFAGPNGVLCVATWHPSYILRLGGIGESKRRQKQHAREFLNDIILALNLAGVEYSEVK